MNINIFRKSTVAPHIGFKDANYKKKKNNNNNNNNKIFLNIVFLPNLEQSIIQGY